MIVTTCKGRRSHLERTLPLWLEHSTERVVVVDWLCPDHVAQWASALEPDRVVALRVEDDHARIFDKPRALELGVRHVRDHEPDEDRVTLLDADTMTTPAFFERLAEVRAAEPRGFSFMRASRVLRDLTGVLDARTEDLLAVGIVDPGIEGWGAEDVLLRLKLHLAGLPCTVLEGELLLPIHHSDGLRTRFYREADRERSLARNEARLAQVWREATGTRLLDVLWQRPDLQELLGFKGMLDDAGLVMLPPRRL